MDSVIHSSKVTPIFFATCFWLSICKCC